MTSQGRPADKSPVPVIDPIASYARSNPQNQAVVDLQPGRRWTYAEMLILQHAGVRAGGIFVPLNWQLAPAEIGILAEDAGPAIFFHDEELAFSDGWFQTGDAGNRL